MIDLSGYCGDWQSKKCTNRLDYIVTSLALWLLALLPVTFLLERITLEIAANGIAVSFIIHCIITKNWHWLKSPPIFILLLLWAYTAIVVTPLALDVGKSASRIAWIRYILLFAAMVFWLSHYRREVRLIALFMGAVLLFTVIDTLTQYTLGVSLTGQPKGILRLSGPLERPVIGIYLAKVSLPFLGLLFYLAWQKSRYGYMFAISLLLAVVFITIILSNERTAIITFAVALATIGIGLFITVKPLRVFLILSMLVGGGLTWGVTSTQDSFQARTEESTKMLDNFWQSPYGQLWRASMMVWQQYPIAGAGMKNFRYACPEVAEPRGITECNLHPHNIYMEFLSEMGIVGLLLFIAFIISLIPFIWKRRDIMNINNNILIFIALAVVILNFFPLGAHQSFFANWPALLAWQSIGWAVMILRSETNREPHG